MFSRHCLILAAPLAGVLAACAFAAPASASSNPLGCRASVAGASSSASPSAAPYVANSAETPCATDSAVASAGTALPGGALGSPTVGPAGAYTTSVDDVTDLGASALVSIDAASVPTPAGAVSLVGPAQASVSYQCENSTMQAAANSTLTAVQVGSQTISVPAGVPDTIALVNSLGVDVGAVVVNQNTVTATSDTEQLVDVQVNGAADEVLGVAQVTQPSSNACAGITGGGGSGTSGSGSGSGSGGASGPGSSGASSVCPSGSTLLASTQECEIITSGSGANAQGIVVSGPNSGEISGASVISLAKARRLYKSACLKGRGPNYVVVGTNKANRITVAKVRERVLALAGKDRVTVTSGSHTCVDGGAGNDTIHATSKAPVTVYGANGNDTIRAGNGADSLSGGNGNDTITAGTGRDHLNGGTGNNRLTAHGKTDYLSAGKGRTVAYVRHANRRYAKRHGIKTVHTIKA